MCTTVVSTEQVLVLHFKCFKLSSYLVPELCYDSYWHWLKTQMTKDNIPPWGTNQTVRRCYCSSCMSSAFPQNYVILIRVQIWNWNFHKTPRLKLHFLNYSHSGPWVGEGAVFGFLQAGSRPPSCVGCCCAAVWPVWGRWRPVRSKPRRWWRTPL